MEPVEALYFADHPTGKYVWKVRAVEERVDGWQIVLYQNTQAQLHGRPESVAALTDELREELRRGPY